MGEYTQKTRIVHKHGTEADWVKAVNFVPRQAEIIVYDADDNFTYERFKIGDGITKVNDLPFATNAGMKDTIADINEDISQLKTAVDNKVAYDAEQDLTDDQKAQARSNIGAGQPQVQSDWSISDESNPGFINNRTHYEEVSLEEFATSVTGSMKTGTAGMVATTSEAFVAGETYLVVWNDANYICVAEKNSLNGMIHIGNKAINNSSLANTGEPFLLWKDSWYTSYLMLSVEETTDYTFSIYKYNGTVYPLDPKYIPDSIQRTITGTEGQVVVINSDGVAIAQDAITNEEINEICASFTGYTVIENAKLGSTLL